MIDENLTSVLNFESEIGIDGTIKLPQEKLIEIRSKGFKKVNVVLFGSSKTAIVEKGIDQNLFDNIKELQSLPDTVVLDLLSVKGSLKNTDIKSRVNFE